ncbi:MULTISPECIES: type II toxin-antitoxin system HipA family toxin [Butyricimonas]|jgi:toxin-antitoxin system, toxin component, hipA family|uniref:Type II toxin-antitoxin system HipA family toxin n=1 Tax=Butyricimonas hominis TaxID=2763032 RepID=A0ABR7D5L9_9BACT|nr:MULTISPECIES: type II toxin-antitoxin system HipA family toxin [Butyricimonas]MBC5623258.1 type II toxin-antitoxin system HipA family toxin [Butyricimonas hominis]MCB6973401.1 type II toxin-antitoxin system HipA family toxin [Butyricimonas synergistica]MCG4520128.1 type II toxin-antitoxin system HipA family toxin [Butyricimonas sp. DFI.6.44]
MKLVDKLTVMYRDRKVGELTLTPDRRRCAFQYDKNWLVSGFSISPLDLPLKPDLFIASPEPFYGNFGIFEDRLPDGYGRYLLNRILRKEKIDDSTLTPLQRLSIVGRTGMGALSYVPESYIGEDKTLPELDELQELALAVLGEKTDEGEEVLYFNSGNSGGCRPKCLYRDADGVWLVKFRHIYDPADMGKTEYKYNLAARRCGIEIPDFKLLEGKYFASMRFDIENGERLHVATAGALLNESILLPKLDYKILLHLTGYLTQDSKAVDEMFRRMVFNVLTSNKDDHAKNFSFICRDGIWTLAPAYDLTLCRAGYNGEHATSVNNSGNPSLEDMIAVGKSIRINEEKGIHIIRSVYEHCQDILSPCWQGVIHDGNC